jgi:hypothetical protein
MALIFAILRHTRVDKTALRGNFAAGGSSNRAPHVWLDTASAAYVPDAPCRQIKMR